MDFWHGTCPYKINPLERIKRVVEAYHIERDLAKARETNCVYTNLKIFERKKYIFEPWLQRVGRFPSARDRQVFLYALLDVPAFDRNCPNCGDGVKDVTRHALQECALC